MPAAIKSVDILQVDLTNTAIASTTLTKSQTVANCIVQDVQIRKEGGSDQNRLFCVDAYFTSTASDAVIVRRNTANSSTYTASVTIWEFESTAADVTVGTYSMSSTTQFTVTIATHTAADTFHRHFMMTTDTADDGDDMHVSAEFASTTEYQLNRQNINGNASGHFYLVRAKTGLFDVQHLKTVNSGDTTSSDKQTLGSAVEPSRTVIIGSTQTIHADDNPSQDSWVVELSASSTAAWSIGNGAGASVGGHFLYLQALQFAESTNTNVQRIELDFGTSITASASITSVNTANSCVINSLMRGATQSDSSGGDANTGAHAVAVLSSGTLVEGRVGTTDGNKKVPLQVVEFNQSAAAGVTLTVQSLEQSQTIDALTLARNVSVSVDALTQSQTIDNVQLGIGLNVQGITQSQTIDNLDLQRQTNLLVNSLEQNQTLENLELDTIINLEVQNITQWQTLDNFDTTRSRSLDVNALEQSQEIDSPNPTINRQLVVDGINQSQSIRQNDPDQEIWLLTNNENALVVQSITQSQTIDDVAITVSSTVTIVPPGYINFFYQDEEEKIRIREALLKNQYLPGDD